MVVLEQLPVLSLLCLLEHTMSQRWALTSPVLSGWVLHLHDYQTVDGTQIHGMH